MRIGILTLPLHTNYGGILQAYALQTVLERMGHKVCLIEKDSSLRLPLWKVPFVYCKRILKNFMGSPVPIFYERKINRKMKDENLVVRQYTEQFISKYIHRRIVRDFRYVHSDDFDAIIVGSDQIWRPKYFHRIEHAYLDFTRGWNIRRIAYAASFGTDSWEYTPDQAKRCAALIKKFDAVSVREACAVSLCKEHFGLDVVHLLDPTMLLEAKDYIKLFEVAKMPQSPGTLLYYILDETPEKLKYINDIAEKKGLVPFRVNSKVENHDAPLQERIQPPVEQWLRGFYDAEFVVADSFHACVFSILFNKPFMVLGNEGRGMSRFTSLLNMFGLQDRLVTSFSEFNADTEIDWESVNAILSEKRNLARRYLHDSLN